MVSNDLVFDLVIGGLGNDLLGQEIALGVVRTAINDLLAVSVADSGKRGELFLAGGIDIDQVSFLGLGCSGIRFLSWWRLRLCRMWPFRPARKTPWQKARA